MNCPTCHHPEHFVIRTQTDSEHGRITRRRQCAQCGCRWSTIEAAADVYDRAEEALELASRLRELGKAA